MKKGHRELEVFKSQHLLNKKEVLTSLNLYIEHCQESEEEEWSDVKRDAVIQLCERFKQVIEEMDDFSVAEDWQFYDYVITGDEIKLVLNLCEEIEVSGNEEIDDMIFTELEMLVCLPCKYYTVEEFAKRFQVTDTTVRQWIRRGKIRHAKKVGRDWLIPELTDRPERGYTPAFYMWKNTLEGEEFKALQGYHCIFICQDEEDKKIFKGILGWPGDRNRKAFEMNIQEREKMEIALIAKAEVEVREIGEGIMYVPPKYAADPAWEKELQKETTPQEELLNYGPVVVTKGVHKGRIGYLDDDDGLVGYVYWGDMLLSLDYYEEIELDYLSNEISTRQLAERIEGLQQKIGLMRARPGGDYFLIAQLLTELLFVEGILTKRYYEAVFLQPEKEVEIFISHASEDASFARCLATDLIQKGYKVFLDDWSIDVGDNILNKIQQGLESAHVIIPLISRYFLESALCQDQWMAFYMAMKEKKGAIIPVVMDKSDVPAVLKSYRCYRMDFTSECYEEMLSSLLKKLKNVEKEVYGGIDNE